MDALTTPPRPPGRPAYGFTRAGHVVELPRPEREAKEDPLTIVTGLHWPAWYPATNDDLAYVIKSQEPKPKKPRPDDQTPSFFGPTGGDDE
jgi:hypothetical protein